nr:hypothetical protein [Tanacetum cinerariifolium]
MENEIDLENKIKELDNILFKVDQSTQTVHMLTKPQAFYKNIHKQALGYQNPFHLRKAQWIKPTLYDGIIMSDKHVAMTMIDDDETLFLEEKSRSKMSEKAKDLEIIDKNISHKPIDYEKLNIHYEGFRKRFTPQQEMDAEQAFWLRISNPTSKPFDASPIIIEAPEELPKASLVNESLKKLKFHLPNLTMFDNNVSLEEELVYQRLRKTLTHVLELSSCIYLDDRACEVLNFDSAGERGWSGLPPFEYQQSRNEKANRNVLNL